MPGKYKVGLNIYRFVSPMPVIITYEVLENDKRQDSKCSAGEIQLYELHNIINYLGGI